MLSEKIKEGGGKNTRLKTTTPNMNIRNEQNANFPESGEEMVTCLNCDNRGHRDCYANDYRI
jgi:hypothetical protein